MNSEEELQKAVTEDIRCHVENGVSLNPYSTLGARTSWQKGYLGIAPCAHTERMDCYKRGQLTAKLMEKT